MLSLMPFISRNVFRGFSDDKTAKKNLQACATGGEGCKKALMAMHAAILHRIQT